MYVLLAARLTLENGDNFDYLARSYEFRLTPIYVSRDASALQNVADSLLAEHGDRFQYYIGEAEFLEVGQ